MISRRPASTALSVLLVSLLFAFATGAMAANAATGSDPKATGSSLPHADARFVDEAARGGLAEVQLGQLAEQKAQNEEVKQFGQRMAQDHSKGNDELKSVVAAKNVMLPDAPAKSARKEMDKLQKLSGADFDKAYMKHMVSDHKKDIKAFEKEAKSGKDPEVRAFAEKTLPTLREHLQLAQAAEATARGETRK